jgi:uncharacterized protein (TIGR03435 family)
MPFVVLYCWIVAGLFGQTFEAASVKPIEPGRQQAFGHSGGPGTKDPGRIHYCCDAMLTLRTRAFGVQSDRVVGPSWISDFGGPNRYVIDATIPAGATKDEFRMMLQNLLVTRFQLKVHHETRNFPGYELVVAKGGPKLNLQPTLGTPKDMAGILPSGARMMSGQGMGRMWIQSQQVGMAKLASTLGPMVTAALGADSADLSIPKARVVDRTGLAGVYDYRIEFACEGCRGTLANVGGLPSISAASDPSGRQSVFQAVESLGLKLEKVRDIPLDVIVVEHVEKAPSAN